MYFIGIDIGSTSTKVAVFDEKSSKFCDMFFMSTGFSGVKTSQDVYEKISLKNYFPSFIVATWYGRVSVSYANLTLTEILCHGIGVNHFFSKYCTVIDVGGQDAKVIKIISNKPEDLSVQLEQESLSKWWQID